MLSCHTRLIYPQFPPHVPTDKNPTKTDPEQPSELRQIAGENSVTPAGHVWALTLPLWRWITEKCVDKLLRFPYSAVAIPRTWS